MYVEFYWLRNILYMVWVLSNVKTFRVKGSTKSGFRTLPFSKELRGLNEKEVTEKFYDEICSRNKLKRKALKIQSVEEIKPENIKNPSVRAFAEVK